MAVADFLVESILDDGLVVGANGNIDVLLGTVFTELALTRVDGTPPELVSVELETVASVLLTVREVENKFFRKPLLVIPRGHIGGLRLDGQGMELLREAIEAKQPREYVSMRATLLDGKEAMS